MINKGKSLIKKCKETYVSVGQYLGAVKVAPARNHVQMTLFVLGLVVLAAGLTLRVMAQDNPEASEVEYDDTRLVTAINSVLGYLEGAFGALIMVTAGIAAILSAAFGQYKAAVGLMIVAIGSFILRSFVNTFFNTTLREGGTE